MPRPGADTLAVRFRSWNGGQQQLLPIELVKASQKLRPPSAGTLRNAMPRDPIDASSKSYLTAQGQLTNTISTTRMSALLQFCRWQPDSDWARDRRLGLAEETSRGTYRLTHDWKERLNALEAHIDIRKQVIKERTQDKAYEKALRSLERETGKFAKALGRTEREWTVRREIALPGGKYLALERHDRVALAPKPPGIEIAPGQTISASMKASTLLISNTPSVQR